MSNVHKLPVNNTSPEPGTFDEFWFHCPKKVGKPLAEVKWNAITGDGLRTKMFDRDSNSYVDVELSATPEELLEGIKRYRATQIDKNTYRLKDEGKFTLQPATFLNRGRWMDE